MDNKIIIIVHWALMIVAITGDLIIIISSIVVSEVSLEGNKLIIILTLPIFIYVFFLKLKTKTWIFFPWQHD